MSAAAFVSMIEMSLPRADLVLPDLALVLDPLRLDRLPGQDALRLQRRARIDLAQFRLLLPLDLERPDLGRRVDALGVDQPVLGDADALGFLLGAHLRVLDADDGGRALLLDLRLLRGLSRLDGAGLLDAGVFEVAVDLERALLSLVVLELDVDAGLVLDPVAQPAALLDLLRQLRQALGVEGVGRVEDGNVGLVQAGERGVLQFEPVESAARAPRSPRPRA